jgi:LIVCS family branched-chain amino acid:cation transporter
MHTISTSSIITAGLAVFAMLFGAGNIVFALSIGNFAQSHNPYAMSGLFISGIIVPLIGLISILLFNGDYRAFFDRIGKGPSLALMFLIMALLGPFGVIPRCIALSYSTVQSALPGIPFILFSLVCCLFIFALTWRPSSILDILGRFLTPLKLGSLIVLIIIGLFYAPEMPITTHSVKTVFLRGFFDGYQTMDLLGTFFIGSVILDYIRRKTANPNNTSECRIIARGAIKASCIGFLLLSIIYFGFSYLSAFYSSGLLTYKPEELVGGIALMVLGSYGGLFVCFMVTVACLTTAVAFSSIFAEYLNKELSRGKIAYLPALIGTLITAFLMSTLDFGGIIKMLAPILQICYPAIIVLCVTNILHKLYGLQTVKIPVAIAFAATLFSYIFL